MDYVSKDILAVLPLSQEKERELAHRIEVGVLARQALESGSGPGSAQELAELAQMGRQAWQHFLLANTRIAWQLAGREARRAQLDCDDLFQEACVALADALRRYDYRRGRFLTYAMPRLRQRLSALSASLLGRIPVPENVAAQRRRIIAIGGALTQEKQATATANDVSAVLGKDVAWVRRTASYSAPMSLVDEEGRLRDVPSDETDFDAGLERQAVHRSLAWLTRVEREVVTMRFGFGGLEPMSLTMVGRRLNMSVSGVRGIEKRALARLRDHLTPGGDDLAA